MKRKCVIELLVFAGLCLALSPGYLLAADSPRDQIQLFYAASVPAVETHASEEHKYNSLPYAQPADPRTLARLEFETYEPLFLQEADTLNPLDLVQTAWNGYVTKKADPAGMTTDLQPMLRYAFNCRALP